jgi:hypothetical protein
MTVIFVFLVYYFIEEKLVKETTDSYIASRISCKYRMKNDRNKIKRSAVKAVVLF